MLTNSATIFDELTRSMLILISIQFIHMSVTLAWAPKTVVPRIPKDLNPPHPGQCPQPTTGFLGGIFLPEQLNTTQHKQTNRSKNQRVISATKS